MLGRNNPESLCGFYRVTIVNISPPMSCPSLVLCIEMAKDIKLFFGLIAPSVYFLSPAPISNSKGNPLSGALNTRGGGNLRFRMKSPFMSAT